METQIEEGIRVVSLFEKGRIKPLIFSWHNRSYRILRTAFTYSKNVGREKIFYFSVECETGMFEISFNQGKFWWNIEKIL